MPRYKITVEYDGGPFVGWQRQDTGPSIQAALEDAVFAFSGERVTVQGAGRTDAGVHALGQVAHFDLAGEKPVEEVRGALNFHLKPHPIVVLAAEIAPAGLPCALLGDLAALSLPHPQPPHAGRRSTAAMSGTCRCRSTPTRWQTAASVLIGHHDFNSFRSIACQAKSSIKTLDAARRRRATARRSAIDVGARSFLHNQVRILVGTLQLVGRGQWSQARCRGGAGRARPHARRADRAAARPLPDGSALRPRRRRREATPRKRLTMSDRK